jgi:hypothetical protein
MTIFEVATTGDRPKMVKDQEIEHERQIATPETTARMTNCQINDFHKELYAMQDAHRDELHDLHWLTKQRSLN